MQYKRHTRKLRAILLAIVMMLTPIAVQAITDEAPEVAENGVYTPAEPEIADSGWTTIDSEILRLTGNFYSLRVVATDGEITVAVITQCPDCPENLWGNEFFAVSTNMYDWEIIAPSTGWAVYYNGYYYWHLNGLHRTSNWLDDWQFHPVPDYPSDNYEWQYMLSNVFDNFEDIIEVPYIPLHDGGIQRIERLPYMEDGGINWVGFVVTDAGRQQLNLYVSGQHINPLDEDISPAISGLSGFSWARDAVEFVMARDLMDMYVCTDTGEMIAFNPSGSASRGDVLAAAIKALELTPPNVLGARDPSFDDVPHFGRGVYIHTARHLGLVAGVGNNNFAPDRTITRQDMMTMLYNILLAGGQIEPDIELSALGRFRDVNQVSSYARLPISSLARAGIISGDGGNINPRGNVTRIEAAVFVWNLYRVVSEG